MPGPVSTDLPIEMPGPVAEKSEQEFATFQVGSGLSKEEEFKRLTGEEWPGQKYYAELNNVEEDYEEPIENWVIYKRNTDDSNDVDTAKDPDDVDQDPNLDPNQQSGQINPDPNSGQPLDQDNSDQDPDQDSNQDHKVEIGDITFKDVKQYLKGYDQAKLEEAKKALEELRPKLTELYARKRSLIGGAKIRAEYEATSKEYEKILAEYDKIKTQEVYEKEGQAIIDQLLIPRIEELRTGITEKLTEFAGGDLEHTNKTQAELDAEKTRLVEEANQTLDEEWNNAQQDRETKVNVAFLQEFLKHKKDLADGTAHTIDGGNEMTGSVRKGYRIFVDKVINNKYLKPALTAAAVAGLAVSGVGLAVGVATGTMAVSLGGYTLGGLAFGAIRGGVTGFLMSRQNSRSSTIGKMPTDGEIEAGLRKINITDEDIDFAGLAGWLLDEYNKASEQDAASNRKRTLVATGLGAAMGAFMSGLRISRVKQQPTQSVPSQSVPPQNQTANLQSQSTPQPTEALPPQPSTEVQYSARDFNKVDVPKGRGIYEVFKQMGGDPSKNQKALEIAKSFDAKYGVVSDASGIHPIGGSLADVYPGKIESWPEIAKSYITEISEEWAKQELIPANTTSIAPAVTTTTTNSATATVANQAIDTVISPTAAVEPVYNAVEEATNAFIPSAFRNFLSRITPYVARATKFNDISAGILGGFIGRSKPEQQTNDIVEPENDQIDDNVVNNARQPIQEYNDKIYNGNLEEEAEFEKLWQQIDPSIKERIIELEKSRSGDPNGLAFRTWLKETKHIDDIEP